jgi:hypothetical protein
MSGNFNMKEWMHQNGQGPYKLHENYIDLKPLGSLKEVKDEEEEDIPTEEEPSKGRPPHPTSLEYWLDDEGNREYDKYTKNYDDVESGAPLEEEEVDGVAPKYEMKCTVDPFYGYDKVKYNGQSINDVQAEDIRVTYDIDIETRSYGIKTAGVYNVSGPSEIELEVYTEDSDDTSETVVVPLDWSKVDMEKVDYLGYIGIDNKIELHLMNTTDGNLAVKRIRIEYNSI